MRNGNIINIECYLNAVGRKNLNSTEKHDIEKDEWIEIGSIMIKKRSFTMLDNYNEYLYAFFGKGDNDNNYPKL